MHLELTGWLLSIYADESDGAVIWLLGEDGSGDEQHGCGRDLGRHGVATATGASKG